MYHCFSDGKEKELSANLEVSSVVSALNKKLSELRSQSEIISRHSKSLHRCLTELETIDLPPDVSTKIKAWMERANLIRIASVGMVTVSICRVISFSYKKTYLRKNKNSEN